MRRGVQFDTYQPQAPVAQGPKPKFAGDSRTAPGPEPRLCIECGKPACFGEGVALLKGIEGDWFCPKHAPDHLKFPERAS